MADDQHEHAGEAGPKARGRAYAPRAVGASAPARRRRASAPHRVVGRQRRWSSVAPGLGYLYFKLNGNLNGVDINAALGPDRPKNVDNGSMDILVLGSDSRAGKNAEYGTDEGTARSDTAMIVHVYKGRKKASVVSVPRDTLDQRPACPKDGKDSPRPGRRCSTPPTRSAARPAP